MAGRLEIRSSVGVCVEQLCGDASLQRVPTEKVSVAPQTLYEVHCEPASGRFCLCEPRPGLWIP